MLRRHQARTVGCAALAAVTLTSLAANPTDSTEKHGRGLQPSLTSIQEMRRYDAVPEENPSPFDRPRLDLVFDLPLADGVQLLRMDNPEDGPKAVDSTGRDLARIEPGFNGDREYIEVEHRWDDSDPWRFKLHLALPSRAAESFNLSMLANAVTFTGAETVTADLDDTWRPLDASVFGPSVEARIEAQRDGVHVSVRPGTIKDTIEDVVLSDGQAELESGWTMWNDQKIDYAFQGKAGATMHATFKVRTGFAEQTVAIELRGQRLP